MADMMDTLKDLLGDNAEDKIKTVMDSFILSNQFMEAFQL